ncbi:MAG: polyhydroxyalkanoic acid system family protein [Myxococcota bacterium]
MALIIEKKKHTMGKEAARKAAEEIAEDIGEKLSAKYHWDGDHLRFERSGAGGFIHVTDDEVRVEVKLALMLRPLKGTVESRIRRYMDEKLK